jgi:di/tricarboxylate transporter
MIMIVIFWLSAAVRGTALLGARVSLPAATIILQPINGSTSDFVFASLPAKFLLSVFCLLLSAGVWGVSPQVFPPLGVESGDFFTYWFNAMAQN